MPTVLITGANRGLGLEFVRQYARDHWRVLACSRHGSSALQAAMSEYDNIEGYALDVTDHQAIERLAEKLGDTEIDVLLNNAGIYGKYSFAEGGVADQAFGATDYADWEHIMRVNVFAPMKMAEQFLDCVVASEQKKIVTLTSMLGSMELNTGGGLYRYRASKAAVNAVMKSMSVDLLPRGILAVAIHPGWARTDMGGPNAEIDIATSVNGVRKCIAELEESRLGGVLTYDGQLLPY
jgi:NAD(P)-dependent dehydrogenase (short-subunit alcohol dehydrogenase family)